MVADVSDMVTVVAVRGVGSRERVVVGSRVAPLACTHTPVSLPAALVAGVVEARGVADLGVVVGVVAAAEAVQVVAAAEAVQAARVVWVTAVAVDAAATVWVAVDLEGVEAVAAVVAAAAVVWVTARPQTATRRPGRDCGR